MKKEDQSVDAPVLIIRGNKILTVGRGWELLEKKKGGEGLKWGSGIGGDRDDIYRG